MFSTDRLLSVSNSDITLHDWDVLNSKIYSSKKVNLIALSAKDSKECNKIESLWKGGNYNDLVICTVGGYKSPDSVKVFGWQEDPLIKKELETIILDKGLMRKSIPEIKNKIENYYRLYDYKQFNYLSKEPSIVVQIISVILSFITAFICINAFSNNYERR